MPLELTCTPSEEIPSSNMISFNTGYSTSNVLTTGEKGVYFCRAVFEEGYTIESDWAAVTPVRKLKLIQAAVPYLFQLLFACIALGNRVVSGTIWLARFKVMVCIQLSWLGF